MRGGHSVLYPHEGVLPVIHLNSNEQAVEAAGVAKEAGARGVFVIDHHSGSMIYTEKLLAATDAIRRSFPDLWTGINCLPLSARDALELAGAAELDGVWVDNATTPIGLSAEAQAARATADVVYFGGVAMKGSGYIYEPDEAAAFIHDHLGYVDVAVTSGPGTGQACPQDRLEAIRAASPDAKLAIASGVDLENLSYHSRLVNYILVASSVETWPYSGVFKKSALGDLIQRDAEIRAEVA